MRSDAWGLVGGSSARAGHLLSIADAFYTPLMPRFLTYGIRCESAAERYLDGVMQDDKVREWYAAARTESEIIEVNEVDYG